MLYIYIYIYIYVILILNYYCNGINSKTTLLVKEITVSEDMKYFIISCIVCLHSDITTSASVNVNNGVL